MKIEMNAPAYFDDHKKLVKILLSAHKKQFVEEVKKQIAEVKAQKKLISKKK